MFHFAGRPIAQLDISGGTENWTFLTTDHLGTPVAATGAGGALLWQGGFEPFGADWSGAAGVFLRFPGQWEEAAFAGGGVGGEIYYNVHRWYQPGTGRYTRPDPLEITGGANLWLYDPNTYLYAWANPIVVTDPLGLYGTNDCSYYDQQCDECGGYYYCTLAPRACRARSASPIPARTMVRETPIRPPTASTEVRLGHNLFGCRVGCYHKIRDLDNQLFS